MPSAIVTRFRLLLPVVSIFLLSMTVALTGTVNQAYSQSPSPPTTSPQTPPQTPGQSSSQGTEASPTGATSGVAEGNPQNPPGPGTNPFFDVQAPAPPGGSSTAPLRPKVQWPTLRHRIARIGGDHLSRSYLVQEAAYVGFYERDGRPTAGFKVPERTQMLYLHPGDNFWNGKIVAISPREVVVLFQAEPEQKVRRDVLSRRPYARTKVTAMGVDEPPPASEGGRPANKTSAPAPPVYPSSMPGFFPADMPPSMVPGTPGKSPSPRGGSRGGGSRGGSATPRSGRPPS